MGVFSAYGRCEETHVEVLSPDGDESWELQLETAHATFRFAIAGPRTLGEIVRFAEAEEPGWAELEVGSVDLAKVVLIRDREPGPARFRLKLLPERGFLDLYFADDQARHLVAAMRDACEDLAPEAPEAG